MPGTRSGRKSLLLAALAALAAGGLAVWLLGGQGEPPVAAPAATPAAPADGAPAASAAIVSPEDTRSTAPAAGGAVTGILVAPAAAGGAKPRVTLTVLREGLPVATAEAGEGIFRVEYERRPEDPAPFRLRAEAALRPPAVVALPSPVFDAGEIRLYQGLVYGGRLRDARGGPVAGVTVTFRVFESDGGTSAPSDERGEFRIPLATGTALQGLFAEDASLPFQIPTLEARARGRLFLPVRAVAEGLTGTHEVVLEERQVSIRLRFSEEASGQPIIGASASLWSANDPLWLMAPERVDEGATDEAGIYAPLWPLSHRFMAAVRLGDRAGRTFWTLLRRVDAESAEPREIVVPREPLVLSVRCVRGEADSPVGGAFVCLGTNAFTFWGTTDARGEVRWALLPSDTFDPEQVEPQSWGVLWRDGDGNPCRDWAKARPPDGVEEIEDGPPAWARGTMVLRLGTSDSPGLWVTASEAGTPLVAAPQSLGIDMPPAKGGGREFAWFGGFSGPVPDARGRPLWWTSLVWNAPELEATLRGLDPGRELSCRLDIPGREEARLDSKPGALLAARRSASPLAFAFPAQESMTRRVLVSGPDGTPAAGAWVVLIRGPMAGQAVVIQAELERAVAGRDGRADLHLLDPGGSHVVVGWDPGTGACGRLDGLVQTAALADWVVRLKRPVEFRARARLPGGAVPARASLLLWPLSQALPMQTLTASREGDFASPPLGLDGYMAQAMITDAKGASYGVFGRASDLNGRDLVPEKSR